MKILLTGSQGFVGRNISSHNKLYKNFELLVPRSDELNLLVYDQVNDYLNKHKPEVIINSAGIVGGIQFNINNNLDSFFYNTLMNVNLMKAAYDNLIEKYINLSSACCYPVDAEQPYKEESIYNGEPEKTNNGYAYSKLFTKKFASVIANMGLKYITIVPCNLFGEFDNYDAESSHLIPSVIRRCYSSKINSNNIISMWGDGEATRELADAADLADFIFFCIENYDLIPSVINFGSGYVYSINDIYMMVLKNLNFSPKIEHDLSKPTGAKSRQLSLVNLKKTGWNKISEFEYSIKKSIKYFLENEKKI